MVFGFAAKRLLYIQSALGRRKTGRRCPSTTFESTMAENRIAQMMILYIIAYILHTRRAHSSSRVLRFPVLVAESSNSGGGAGGGDMGSSSRREGCVNVTGSRLPEGWHNITLNSQVRRSHTKSGGTTETKKCLPDDGSRNCRYTTSQLAIPDSLICFEVSITSYSGALSLFFTARAISNSSVLVTFGTSST